MSEGDGLKRSNQHRPEAETSPAGGLSHRNDWQPNHPPGGRHNCYYVSASGLSVTQGLCSGGSRHRQRYVGLRPENSVGLRPENSVGQRPENSVGLQPENSVSLRPENSVGQRPENSVGLQPENSVSLRPENSVGLRPENSATSSAVFDAWGRSDKRWLKLAAVVYVLLCSMVPASCSAQAPVEAATGSIADRSVSWPTSSQWRRVVLMEDYNTRVVLFGVTVLGAAAGLVGSFTLLRKRALLGDALSHATLPGLALAFIVASGLGMDGKSLPILLGGATISGLLGVAVVLIVRSQTRLKEDAALGIALSVFFGFGMALVGVVQQMDTGHAAGLESFIYGKTASMNANDANLIAAASFIAIVGCLGLFKEFKLLCFDENFAGSRGMPVLGLDLALMSLVVLVTIVGLQAVGLILVVALFVTPAAAARFWTEKMWVMGWLAALIGGIGGVIGGAASALFPRLPSGAMIVLASTALFGISLFLGTERGVVVRLHRRFSVNRRIRRQHLLRGLYELLELDEAGASGQHATLKSKTTSIDQLVAIRSWSRRQLWRTIRSADREELVTIRDSTIGLTQSGYVEGARLTRQHRLWELYLITHAEVAASRVDRDADAIEHVLGPELVDELETLLEQQPVEIAVPESPHTAADGVAT